MKRLLIVFLVFNISLFFFSCTKDNPSSSDNADTQAPTVSILFPVNGSEIKIDTTYTVIADANDNKGVSSVDFYIDGNKVGTDNTSPYKYSWNTTSNAGDHSIMAKASDAAGNVASSIVIAVKVKEKILNKVFGYVKNKNNVAMPNVQMKLSALSALSRSGMTKQIGQAAVDRNPVIKTRLQKNNEGLAQILRKQKLNIEVIQNTDLSKKTSTNSVQSLLKTVGDTSVVTNSQGYYEIGNLAPNRYAISATLADYDTYADSVNLTASSVQKDIFIVSSILPQVSSLTLTDNSYKIGAAWTAISKQTHKGYNAYEKHFLWYKDDISEDATYFYLTFSPVLRSNNSIITTNAYDLTTEEYNGRYSIYILPVNIDDKETPSASNTILQYLDLPDNRRVLSTFELTTTSGPVIIPQSTHEVSLHMRYYYANVAQLFQLGTNSSWSIQFSQDSLNWTTVGTHSINGSLLVKNNYGYTKVISINSWKGKTIYFRTNPTTLTNIQAQYGPLTIENIIAECSQDGTPLVTNNPPEAPSSPSPSDGATGVSTSPTLSWSCSDPDDDAVTYDVYFGTSSNPTTTIATNQNALSISRTGLASSTPYYWKIVAKDSKGATTTGSVWSFTTGAATNNPPAAPSSPSPSDGATGVSTSPTLSWSCSDPDGDAVTYDVYFGTSSNPTTTIATNQNALSISRTGLASSTPYYWKIVAKDSKGATTTGLVWSFTTVAVVNNPPNAPSSPSPWNGATGVSTSLTLSWSCSDPDSDALKYDVYFGTSSDPTTTIATNQTGLSISRTGLASSTPYYWKIVAKDSKGATTTGSVWSFTTGSGVVSQGMVSVAGGTFTAGSTPVTISSFKMDKYEVTYELWTDVRTWALTHGYTNLSAGMKGGLETGSPSNGTDNPVTFVSWYDVVKWCNARSEKDGLTPVYYTNSSFIDANVYKTGETIIDNTMVNWTANGYRLPTETEWEFAARGGTSSQGSIYSGSNTIGNVAWYYSNSGKQTHTVGQKSANELGIYDMSGNAWEWCWDLYDYSAYPSGGTIDPKGPLTTEGYRVFRGGSFYEFEDYHRVDRRDSRWPNHLDGYSFFIGFRCVQK